METKLERDVRFLKIYAAVITVFCATLFVTGFATKNDEQKFDEITAKRIKVVDSNGKVGLLLAADYKKEAPGVFFFNQDGTESGALFYHGKRDRDGKIEAYSLLTMDQFKSDQIVVLQYDHSGDQKRYGLVINDRPDTLSPHAEKLLDDLRVALQSAKTEEEAQALRKEYMSKIPAKEIVARRLFAGRDVEGASQVTLSDPDGKPRMQLKVDNAGRASITFLDASGKVVRTIKP